MHPTTSSALLTCLFLLGAASAFPQLFARPRLFQTQSQQASQQQQQQQQPMAPAFAGFGLQQADLLRVGAAQQHQVPFGAASFPQPAGLVELQPEQLFPMAAAYHGQPAVQHPLLDHQALAVEPEMQRFQPAESRQQALAPSQSKQVVEKIERHIEQQIEQSLNAMSQAEASGYGEPAHKEAGKEAAASGGDEHEEPEELQEEVMGGEEKEKEKGKEKEKEEEKHQEPEKKGEQEQEQHESPPEAFEVHHKKGGKSFQYFHQGHQHP